MYEELIKALRSLAVETGSLVCLGCGHEHNCGIHGCAIIRGAADRLAAYEDTGLEPEEIRSLRMDMAIIKAMFGDADVKRMKELCEADKEGRVVVLPCKVGDTVYWMWPDGEGGCDGPIYEACVYGICVTKNGIELYRDPCDSGFGMIGIHPNRAIFLTRAEAEAAIGGGGGG